MVTLTLVASDPLTLIPVYPIPAPASEVVTTPGKYCSKIGKSWPKFLDSKSSAFTLEKDTPIAFVALRALTKTSFKAISFWSKLSVCFFGAPLDGCFVWAQTAVVSSAVASVVKTIFIRNKISTNKRGCYSG